MNDSSSRTKGQGGPPLGVLGIVFTGLFLAGLILSAVLADGQNFPSPFADSTTVLAYFRGEPDAVGISAFFQFAAAIPLAIYAATVSARLHNLGVRAPGATIALAGGLLAAGFLMLSGMATWALSQAEVVAESAVVKALQFLAFAAGGPGHVVPLGLLLAGIAVPGLLARLLPRWLAWTGLVIAGVAELATLSLLVPEAAFLLPIARFTGLIWLIGVGFALPRQRARKNATA